MNTYLFFVGIIFTLLSCDQQVEERKMTTKIYYPKEGITQVSEIDKDSILNGKTLWYDSQNKIYLEENYLNGQLLGISKQYYENGSVAIENDYYKGKIISKKEYSENGNLRFQEPIALNEIGPLEIQINNGARDYLIKNQEDTIEFKAKNLPFGNQTISATNASLRKSTSHWIIKPGNKSNKVKIYLGYRKNHNSKSKDIILDSAIIEIK